MLDCETIICEEQLFVNCKQAIAATLYGYLIYKINLP